MKKTYPLLISLFVLILGIAGSVAAQDTGPQLSDAVQAELAAQGAGPQAVEAQLGTAFTYQGNLRKANGPVNGACDMTFRLFDAATAGSPIGNAVSLAVPVANGVFTAGLDFGGAAFNGEARWLEIGVKCAGDAAFATLSPRQSITPAPYALALPGLRIEQNATSPNVIGGSAGNIVDDLLQGGTIGGGGNGTLINRITASFGTIGGGFGNTAGAESTIGGGAYNRAGLEATVGGGKVNYADSQWATIGGGAGNAITDGDTMIGATISGGLHNRTAGEAAAIGGGAYNTASATYATVPGGRGALASHYAETAYAGGSFAHFGDAQTSQYVLSRLVPSDRTLQELFLDGAAFTLGRRLTIVTGRTLTFDILIVARSDNGKSSGWRFEGVIENDSGTVRFIGTPAKTTLGEDDPIWDVDLVADDANDALVIKGFSNSSGDTIRFVATVRTVEVAW